METLSSLEGSMPGIKNGVPKDAVFWQVRILRILASHPLPESMNHWGSRDGAVEKTRTSTGFTPQRPQRCASTNSATTACSW